MTSRVRLDTLVVKHRLAETRTRARALVLAGNVSVNGVVVSKAGAPTSADAVITLAKPDHPYVGRGGVKLAHALKTFGIDVTDCTVLDIGASTGGFTDALLQRDAKRVVALDVGHGQLAWRLRQDPSVVVLEGINARTLAADMLPTDCRQVDLITIDVAFISLALVVNRVPALLRVGGDVVALVKPQFEAGRAEVGKNGIVTNPVVQQRVVDEVAAAGDRVGLCWVATTPSPITGAEGNQEFFLHLRK